MDGQTLLLEGRPGKTRSQRTFIVLHTKGFMICLAESRESLKSLSKEVAERFSYPEMAGSRWKDGSVTRIQGE